MTKFYIIMKIYMLIYEKGFQGFYVQSRFAGTKNLCENQISNYKNDICSFLDNCYTGNKLLDKKIA